MFGQTTEYPGGVVTARNDLEKLVISWCENGVIVAKSEITGEIIKVQSDSEFITITFKGEGYFEHDETHHILNPIMNGSNPIKISINNLTKKLTYH